MKWPCPVLVALLAILFVRCGSSPESTSGIEAPSAPDPAGGDPARAGDGGKPGAGTGSNASPREPSALDLLHRSASLDTPLKRKIEAWDRAIESGLAAQAKAGRKQGRAGLEAMLKVVEAKEAAGQATVADVYLRGRLLGKLDRIDEARATFARTLTLDPEFLYGYEGQALCARTARRGVEVLALKTVEDLMDRAFRIWGDFPRGLLLLGQALLLNGRPQQALTVLDKIPPDHPASKDAAMLLAKAYGSMGQLSRAQVALQNALNRFPESIDLKVELAIVLIESSQGKPDKLDRAEKTLQRLLAEDPTHPEALWYMATVRKRRGQTEEAIEILNRLATNPDLPRHFRVRAAMRIAKLKLADDQGPTLPEMIETLKSEPDPAKRREAASMLLPTLRLIAGSPKPNTEAFGVILKALSSRLDVKRESDQHVRVYAVRGIGYALDIRAIPPDDSFAKLFTRLLDPALEPSRLVRGSAANALAGFPIERAPLGELVKALEDPDDYVFRQARAALQRITGQRFHVDLGGPLAPEEKLQVVAGWQKWYEQWSARDPASKKTSPKG